MTAGLLPTPAQRLTEAEIAAEAMRSRTAVERRATRHIVSVHLEDWFQVGAFHKLIDREQWYRFDTRLERNAQAALELLAKTNTRATFFVLGWVAEQFPDLVAAIAQQGHEIACADFAHRRVDEFSPAQFLDDVKRSRDAVESAINQRVLGFRTANGWIGKNDLWALDVLAQEGFTYDSSLLTGVFGRGQSAGGALHGRDTHVLHQRQTTNGSLWEVPPSTWSCCGFRLPIAGGNWFRQLPHSVLKHAIAQWDQTSDSPFVMYFHAWELDPEQPRITAADRITRVRHYRNLEKMRWVVEDYLSRYSFGAIADVLKIEDQPRTPVELRTGPVAAVRSHSEDVPVRRVTKVPVTVVIPCYNEEDSLPYLARTLERVEFELSQPQVIPSASTDGVPATGSEWQSFSPTFLFVDDRSRDNTWDVMQQVFGQKSNCKLVRHETNQGVSAAILTGIKHAETEAVCSMDCDCSYDPVELKRMLPLLTSDVDLVTASPYHPRGRVKNVPSWRLLLSKGLSTIYRQILPARLHTWTSCFRVYRKSAIEGLDLRENGFLGTAELVAQLARGGSKIVEHPATLEVRIFGESKMKTCRTIRGHLGLIARLLREPAKRPQT